MLDCPPEYNIAPLVCKVLKKSPPIRLTKFMGHNICVKRSPQNFKQIHEKLKRINNNNSTYSKEDIMKVTDVVLDDSAVKSIKFVDKKRHTIAELTQQSSGNVFKEFQLTGNYSVYVEYIGPSRVANGFLEEIIIDLKLYNYLWCGLSDLAIPAPTNEMVSKQRVSFGYMHCDMLGIQERIFWFDNWARTVKLNAPDDVMFTKMDFYDKNVLNEIKYYNQDGKFNLNTPFTENVLLAEKYFSGLGCADLPDPKEMVENYTQLPNLRKIGIALLAFIVIVVLLTFIHQMCFFKQNKKIMLIMVFVMTLFSFLAFITGLAHLIISRGSYDKILAYQENCKNNLKTTGFNDQSTSTMELDYLYSLYYIRTLGGLTLIVVLGNLGSLVLHLLTCKCWSEDDKDPKEEIDVNGSKNVEIQEFDKVPSNKQ